MHDWRKLVQVQLAKLSLPPGTKADVVDELATHLEETCAELRARGFSDEDAAQRALCEVKDWHDLRRRIQIARRSENNMSNRVKQIWLPSLLTLFLAMVLLEIIQMVGPNPWTSAPGNHLRMMPVAVVYLAWLLMLPLIGAMGAYLSNRAGGSWRAVFISIEFPVLPYLAFFVVGLPVALILDDRVAHNITIPAFFVGLSSWVIFPAVALLAGGLPVQLFASRRLSSRRVTGS